MKQILLVEDDMMIASSLVYALEQEGYAPTHCKDVVSSYMALKNNRYDLAILDVELPDGTGFDISEKLYKTDTAIIFLTVVDDEQKIVSAFENGVADYVTKPFRLREFLARIKRTLNNTNKTTNIISIGGINIDVDAGKVYIDNSHIELTALEYRLLLIFANNKSKLLTRTQILEQIWDSSGNFVEDNTLTVYIKRLREKVGDAINIETVRGIGYRVD